MAHETSLVPNFTFFIQLGIFIACYTVLRIFVFGPYLRLVHMREEKTTGLKAKAMQLTEQARKYQLDYETFMREERKKVAIWVDEERRKVADEERQIVQAARESANTEMQRVREEVKKEFSKARSELLPNISEYSSSIATKLVGHPIKVPASSSHRAEGKAEQVV